LRRSNRSGACLRSYLRRGRGWRRWLDRLGCSLRGRLAEELLSVKLDPDDPIPGKAFEPRLSRPVQYPKRKGRLPGRLEHAGLCVVSSVRPQSPQSSPFVRLLLPLNEEVIHRPRLLAPQKDEPYSQGVELISRIGLLDPKNGPVLGYTGLGLEVPFRVNDPNQVAGGTPRICGYGEGKCEGQRD
jgi:hypothetical protein